MTLKQGDVIAEKDFCIIEFLWWKSTTNGIPTKGPVILNLIFVHDINPIGTYFEQTVEFLVIWDTMVLM